MPKSLFGHSSLTQGNDLIVLGGKSAIDGNHYSSSVFKLSCKNEQFKWEELEVKLQTGRSRFVVAFISIADHLSLLGNSNFGPKISSDIPIKWRY